MEQGLGEISTALQAGWHVDRFRNSAGTVSLELVVDGEQDALLTAHQFGDAQRAPKHDAATRVGVGRLVHTGAGHGESPRVPEGVAQAERCVAHVQTARVSAPVAEGHGIGAGLPVRALWRVRAAPPTGWTLGSAGASWSPGSAWTAGAARAARAAAESTGASGAAAWTAGPAGPPGPRGPLCAAIPGFPPGLSPPGPPIGGPPRPIIPGPPMGSIPMGRPPNPQSFCCAMPRALLMLPCTTNEFAALWLRSAISSFFIAPSLPNAPASADWLTSRRWNPLCCEQRRPVGGGLISSRLGLAVPPLRVVILRGPGPGPGTPGFLRLGCGSSCGWRRLRRGEGCWRRGRCWSGLQTGKERFLGQELQFPFRRRSGGRDADFPADLREPKHFDLDRPNAIAQLREVKRALLVGRSDGFLVALNCGYGDAGDGQTTGLDSTAVFRSHQPGDGHPGGHQAPKTSASAFRGHVHHLVHCRVQNPSEPLWC